MRITGGTARGLRLFVPRRSQLRPTSDRVRGAIFQLVGQEVDESRVLDLYAGSGALGIEALSRGATAVDFVEQDPRLCQVIQRNLESTGFAKFGRVHKAHVEQALLFLEGPYGLVLLDPPYGPAMALQVYDIMAGGSLQGVLDKAALVVLEHASREMPAEEVGLLVRTDSKRYGDTAVSIYRLREA